MLTVEAIEASAPAIPDATRIGAWLLSCGNKNQAADRHACALQSAGASGISAAIVVQAEKATPVLVLRAPLGVILPAGIDMAVDGKRLGRLAFQTCDRDGCAAPALVSGSLGAALRKGQRATVTFRLAVGGPIQSTLPLDGLADALGRLAAENTAATGMKP
jgi:invasion protein IalB